MRISPDGSRSLARAAFSADYGVAVRLSGRVSIEAGEVEVGAAGERLRRRRAVSAGVDAVSWSVR
jgi:hypothetical protein